LTNRIPCSFESYYVYGQIIKAVFEYLYFWDIILRMITRTFRIPPEYDKILGEEAEAHGLSISALLNQIIRQYVMVSRFNERAPNITLSYTTFAPMLDIMPDKELEQVAEKTGTILPEEAILQHGKRLDFDSVNWFIDTIYGHYGNWFDPKTSMIDGKERVHLTHQLNHKWSMYLGSFMKGMFQSILDSKPIIETRANSVTLYLTPPKGSNMKRMIK
jgi:hypothetical protein